MIYMGFQIGSGLILTASYTPDFSSIESNLSQEIVLVRLQFHYW